MNSGFKSYIDFDCLIPRGREMMCFSQLMSSVIPGKAVITKSVDQFNGRKGSALW